jgi:hypothetical protein
MAISNDSKVNTAVEHHDAHSSSHANEEYEIVGFVAESSELPKGVIAEETTSMAEEC